jgi:hypothetical protein
MGGTE